MPEIKVASTPDTIPTMYSQERNYGGGQAWLRIRHEIILARAAGRSIASLAREYQLTTHRINGMVRSEQSRRSGMRRRADALALMTVREAHYGAASEALERGLADEDPFNAARIGVLVLKGTGDLQTSKDNAPAAGDTYNLTVINATNEQLNESLEKTRAILVRAGVDPESAEALPADQVGVGATDNPRKHKRSTKGRSLVAPQRHKDV